MLTTNATYSQSAELYRRATLSLAGGVSSNFRLGGHPSPLYFSRAQGAVLEDVDGNRYVDYALGMGPVILGHAHPAVSEAVAAALKDGQLYAGQHRAEIELAERICQLMPSAELVRFGSSGSEMVQAALRLARAATGRSKILKFEGHYHGWLDTIYANAAPSVPAQRGHIATTQLASAGQSAAAASDLIVLPWNDLEAFHAAIDQYGSVIAGVVMESILCNTGVITPDKEYINAVRSLCDRNGTVLIFDEVITGFRLSLGGAQQVLGVTPDLTVLAKAIANGFPLAALTGREELMKLFGDGSVMHGGTYNTNTTSVAAANATLSTLAANAGSAQKSLVDKGEKLMAGLRDAAGSAGVRMVVQGYGSVFNTAFLRDDAESSDIRDYPTYIATDLDRQRAFLYGLQDRGVRVTGRGTWFLSASHTDEQTEMTVEAARAVLAG